MANKIYIPTFVSDQNYTPARVNPRVFFYNGTLSCEPFLIEGIENSSITQTEVNAFPYFDHYSSNRTGGTEPGPDSDSLLFLNENPTYGQLPTASLYDEYWETYVSLLYDPSTRLLDASAIISLGDYNEMELNDIVQFRGNYYHLRAINEYDVKTGVCNIQLLGPVLADSLNRTAIPINCEFDFTAVNYSPTTTTTSTTAAPTTTTTTSTTSGVTFSALGGTTGSFTSGGVDYKYHEFANTDRDTTETFSLTTLAGSTTDARVLVVAGGAGGGVNFSGNGALGGGGGGGQVIASSSITLSYPNNYSIQVGKGGDARLLADGSGPGGRGDDSYFSGSGINIYSNAGYPGQGVSDYDGGSSWLYLYGDGNANGNGGGGASAAQNGQNADSTNGGDGGDGLQVVLGYEPSPNLGNDYTSGGNYLLGAGGGGSSINSLDRGLGGDQHGGDGRDSRLATDGGRYYGAGGGGGEVVSDTRGSAGGDGIVIVIYPIN